MVSVSAYPKFIWVIRSLQMMGFLIVSVGTVATIYLAVAKGGIPFSGDHPVTWSSSIRSVGTGFGMIILPQMILRKAPHLFFGENWDGKEA